MFCRRWSSCLSNCGPLLVGWFWFKNICRLLVSHDTLSNVWVIRTCKRAQKPQFRLYFLEMYKSWLLCDYTKKKRLLDKVLTNADTLFHQLKTFKANLKASRSNIRPFFCFKFLLRRAGARWPRKEEQRVLPKFPHLSGYFKTPHFRHCGGIVLTLRGAIFPKLN